MSYSGQVFSPSEAVRKPPLFHILLVDDNALIRGILKRFISIHFKQTNVSPDRVQFDQAINKKAAMDFINKRLENKEPHYHLIFMDINMSPDTPQEGLVATKEIREIEIQKIADGDLKENEKSIIVRYSTETPIPSEAELKAQGFDMMLNKIQTTQPQVDAVLKAVLAKFPNITYRDASPNLGK